MLGEDKLRGLILDNLFGMFCYFTNAGTFDFVSNILANVSGLKEARLYMVENQMLKKLVEMLKSPGLLNDHRR